jgi:hypothetical protein
VKALWLKLIHPMRTLDAWWQVRSPERRLDRDPIGLAALIGFAGLTSSILLVGPTPNSSLVDMPNGLQVLMCGCIVLGLLRMAYGALRGLPWFFPSTTVKRSYTIGFTGAPAAVFGLGVHSFYIITNPETWTSALSAGLTPLLAVGISAQAFLYLLEVRRIERVENALIREAKAVIADEHDHNT